MAFNLKLVLKALLFSSSQPLTVKDVQTVFARYHDQAHAALLPAEDAEGGDAAEARDEAAAVPALAASPVEASGEDAAQLPPPEVDLLGQPATDHELYADVPSLVTATQIREAMAELAAELKAQNDIYLLIDGANGFRLVTHPRFAKWIRVQRDEPPPVKLTQPAIETLAVVAYRQPVTRSEIESVRGVSAENVLNKLMERELIYVVGRADLPGRPIQYGTTDKFLEFVGVKSLVELPASDVLSPRQIDEWLNRSVAAKPPADAEMGLPLEEGEGESPSLFPVEIEHAAPAASDPAASVPAHEAARAAAESDAAEDAELSIEGDAPSVEASDPALDEPKKDEPAA